MTRLVQRAAAVVALGAILAVAAPATAAESEADRIKLAVLDLQGKGVEASLVQNLTDVATVSLNKLGVFDVLSRADIQQMLSFEEDKQMLGCSDASCLAEVGGALGVALLISGSVGKVGSNFLVNLTLTDTSSVKVMAREQREVATVEGLTASVEAAARFLVRELLEGRQGYLVLKSSESGADVEIDGRIIGVTPLPRQTLSGGPHTLKVVKKGFITWARDVDIEKDQASVVDAALVPSLEFIDDYEGRASTLRTLAYIIGGVGIAAVGFGIGGWLYNDGQARQYERDLAAANCDEGATADASGDCTSFESRRSNIGTFDLLTQVAGFAGIAAIGTAVFMFIYAPEPGLYDQYRPESSTSVGAMIVPIAGGAAALGTLRF